MSRLARTRHRARKACPSGKIGDSDLNSALVGAELRSLSPNWAAETDTLGAGSGEAARIGQREHGRGS